MVPVPHTDLRHGQDLRRSQGTLLCRTRVLGVRLNIDFPVPHTDLPHGQDLRRSQGNYELLNGIACWYNKTKGVVAMHDTYGSIWQIKKLHLMSTSGAHNDQM